MPFNVTNTFEAGSDADSADINQNFSDIEDELNAFPTNGSLKDGIISNNMIQAGSITTAKLAQVETSALSTSTTDLITSGPVKTYIDARVFSSFYGIYVAQADKGLNDSFSRHWLDTYSSGQTGRIGSGVYYINKDGTYLVGYFCTMHANAHGNVKAKLTDRGTVLHNSYSDGNSSLTQDVVIGGCATRYFTSGDWIDVQVAATNGRGGTCYQTYLYVSRL
jgi:hypothetical protein